MSRSGLRRQPLHAAAATRREAPPEVRLAPAEASPSPGRRRGNMDGGKIRGKPVGFSEDSEDLDSSQDSQLSDFSGEESTGPSPVASRTRSKDSVERDLLRKRTAKFKAAAKARAQNKENVETVTQTKSSAARTCTIRYDRAKVDGATTSPKQTTNVADLCMYIAITGFVIVVLTAIALPMFRKDQHQLQGSPAIDSPEMYKEHVVGAMGRALLYPPAIITQPAVLLVAAAPGTHDTARCVARHVAQGFDKRPTIVHGEKLRGLDADEAKKHLDEVLHAGFSQGGKAAVVYSLQDIPLQANLIFHSYCDNTNAPYKETAIILVLQLEEPISMDRSNSEIEGEVLDRLQSHLGRGGVLDIDKVGALMSRMAGFVLVVDKNDDLPTSCS
ncbi:PREDICTED: torsin-1A-interacting protein 1-like [Branchiostoma belcheri]|uniref:Torsin-1A-interacting protein 1-like n=1 Tax=Branchiostoma belcheri TaxID=7741 RepID=A0A6P4ZQT7_BRABE|nr:PREDICTED: torsin-1A-interacting protein 1-like [Branchiostoma belcheri]